MLGAEAPARATWLRMVHVPLITRTATRAGAPIRDPIAAARADALENVMLEDHAGIHGAFVAVLAEVVTVTPFTKRAVEGPSLEIFASTDVCRQSAASLPCWRTSATSADTRRAHVCS